MILRTAEEAIEEFKSFDAWQYADIEAVWKWMFNQGYQAGKAASTEGNEVYYLDH